MQPTKFILDYSKWRCGFHGDHALGKGVTALLNDQGYMCCLGQWSKQLGATDDELMHKVSPWHIKRVLPALTKATEYGFCNTDLAIRAMSINDCGDTTPERKINELTELLAPYNIELEVINIPK